MAPQQPQPQPSPSRRLSRQRRPGEGGPPPAPSAGANQQHPQQQGGRPSLDQRRTSLTQAPSGSGPPADAPLHPEIRSIVGLVGAHAHKIYFSGPMIRHVDRSTDGSHPTPAKDEGWVEVWAQLGGTTLSVWDMKAIEIANREGREVPPTYVNVMDAVSAAP
jgi:CCR4-NOT transcriptional complex subunit CAF120